MKVYTRERGGVIHEIQVDCAARKIVLLSHTDEAAYALERELAGEDPCGCHTARAIFYRWLSQPDKRTRLQHDLEALIEKAVKDNGEVIYAGRALINFEIGEA